MNPDNRLVLSCWWYQGQKKSIRGNEFETQDLLDDIERADFIVAHNAKFELQWLERCGLDLTNVLVYDTMLGEYVIAGNRRVPLGLDAIAKRVLNERKMSIVSMMIKMGIPVEHIPAPWLLRYCHVDVDLCRRIFLAQRDYLKENNLLPVVYNRCLLTVVLADIEKNGMYVDAEKVNVQYQEGMERLQEIQGQLRDLMGDVNPQSPKQIGAYLYDTLGFEELKRRGEPLRTPAGGRKADASTINSLVATTKDQRRFKKLYGEWSQVNAAVGKGLSKFKLAVDEYDNMVHARFNQTTTMTHRLSSSGTNTKVQFQNFSRAFKPLFTARNEGWLMGEADGAQIEFRVAAELGDDEQARKDIDDGFDVHTFTASIINDVKESEVNYNQRQDAKADTFKPLYGGQSGTKSQKKYYAAFKEKYSSIASTQNSWALTAAKTKRQVTPWGLTYYWPDCSMNTRGYVSYSTQIYNYPIQALATAEIVPIAIVFTWHRLKRANARLFIVNTVHDSIIVELPPEERELFKETSVQAFTHDVYRFLNQLYGMEFRTTLGTGTTIGTHWNVGEEEKVGIPSPFNTNKEE